MYNTKATEGERSVTIIHVEVLEETKFSHKSQSPVGLPRHTFPHTVNKYRHHIGMVKHLYL